MFEVYRRDSPFGRHPYRGTASVFVRWRGADSREHVDAACDRDGVYAVDIPAVYAERIQRTLRATLSARCEQREQGDPTAFRAEDVVLPERHLWNGRGRMGICWRGGPFSRVLLTKRLSDVTCVDCNRIIKERHASGAARRR